MGISLWNLFRAPWSLILSTSCWLFGFLLLLAPATILAQPIPEPNPCSTLNHLSNSDDLTRCEDFAIDHGLEQLEEFATVHCTVFGLTLSRPSSLIEVCKTYLDNHPGLPHRDHFLSELSRMKEGNIVASSEPDNSGWAVYLDNDVLAMDSWTHVNDDRNYTMGLSIASGGNRFSSNLLGRARETVDNWLRSHDSSAHRTFHSQVFGVTAFTPNDLEQEVPVPNDRPYASLLFLSNQIVSTDSAEQRAQKSSLTLGVLGLDIAKGFQRWLHNDVGISDQDPRGWNNQISDGGELTALYASETQKLLLDPDSSHADLAFNYGYSVGYYTNFSAGLDLRIGPRVDSRFYEHSSNPMANFNQAKRTNTPRDHYGFLSYKATLIGYNALLQGQFRNSVQTFNSSDIERLVHWVAVGWVYQFRNSYKLSYSFNFRSQEYKGPEARDHYWGGLYLTRTLGH